MVKFPKIQDCWIWPDSVERWFRERRRGKTLHVCCGKSNLGDVTFDIDPDNDPDVLGTMWDLPFPDMSFETAIWDPPWRMDPKRRWQSLFEIMRVVELNGAVLTNTEWLIFSVQGSVEELAVRQDSPMGSASLLQHMVKRPGQTQLPVNIETAV